jgi:hypothetical protein
MSQIFKVRSMHPFMQVFKQFKFPKRNLHRLNKVMHWYKIYCLKFSKFLMHRFMPCVHQLMIMQIIHRFNRLHAPVHKPVFRKWQVWCTFCNKKKLLRKTFTWIFAYIKGWQWHEPTRESFEAWFENWLVNLVHELNELNLSQNLSSLSKWAEYKLHI